MNVKTPITMLVLLALLAGGVYYGWQTIVAPEPGPAATEPSEPTETCVDPQRYTAGEVLRPKKVTVNVYNTGLVSGLASDTLEELRDRGFRRGVAENAPEGVEAANVSIVTEYPGSAEVKLVAKQFKGRVQIVAGEDFRSGVDIVLGTDFDRVGKKPVKKLKIKRDREVCAVTD